MVIYDFDFQCYVDCNNVRQGVIVDGECFEFGDYVFVGDLCVLCCFNKMKFVYIVVEVMVCFWKLVQ